MYFRELLHLQMIFTKNSYKYMCGKKKDKQKIKDILFVPFFKKKNLTKTCGKENDKKKKIKDIFCPIFTKKNL
jgi:hypothetical protein